MSFDEALDFTLGREGGYSNHPADPGGETFRGVTAATYEAYRKRQKLPPRPVTEITENETRLIYLEYWLGARCQDLPEKIATCVFDAAVNMGPAQAVLQLQRALWVDADGRPGPNTTAAALEADELRTCYAMLTLRREFYVALARKNGPTFIRGWIARVEALWRTVGT